MKKTLLMFAVTFAVSAVFSWADPYSQNIVGYVTTKVPAGSANVPIGAPFLAGTNTVEGVMPAIKKGDMVSFWTGSSFVTLIFAGPDFDGHGHAWVDGHGDGQDSPRINPGRPFVYQNNNDTVTNTFCGSIPTTNSTTLAGGHAFSLLVSVIPVSDKLDSDSFSLPLQAGDKVFVWIDGQYHAFTYQGANFDGLGHAFADDSGEGQPSPVLQVGQAFFYQNNQAAAEIWNQSLKIK